MPAAADNRPLRLRSGKDGSTVIFFATPALERELRQIAEQDHPPDRLMTGDRIRRPGQIDDLIGEIKRRTDRGARAVRR
jgi:excinuclease UvrABC helicase subunit UvrB